MEQLKKVLAENENTIDYEFMQSNKDIRKLVYSFVDIQHEQSPFDYFDHLWLEDDGTFGASIFIEPVGNLWFKSSSMEDFFSQLNAMFNAQPNDTNYILAGHQLHHYATSVRKGHGIDFRYLDVEQLWSLDINAEYEKSLLPKITFEQIKKGKDVFEYIKQKNRLPIVVLDGICFINDGIADLMMGEIIHVEEYMPDFFKAIIDLSKFEEHNQYIFEKSGYQKDFYPKNRIVEQYISYEEEWKPTDEIQDIQLLKEEEIPMIYAEAKEYWESGFDGEYLEYREYKNRV